MVGDFLRLGLDTVPAWPQCCHMTTYDHKPSPAPGGYITQKVTRRSARRAVCRVCGETITRGMTFEYPWRHGR